MCQRQQFYCSRISLNALGAAVGKSGRDGRNAFAGRRWSSEDRLAEPSGRADSLRGLFLRIVPGKELDGPWVYGMIGSQYSVRRNLICRVTPKQSTFCRTAV